MKVTGKQMWMRLLSQVTRIIACYLVASAAYLVYFRWRHEGHADVPFSGFPGFFLLSPFAPAFLWVDFATRSWRALPGALLYAVVLAVSLWLALRTRRMRNKPSGVSGFAWALLFLSGGRMPPPPPQSQIEQEAEERKNRAVGRDEAS